jgi:hypothetical protein
MTRCPHCDAEVSPSALVCRACNRRLDEKKGTATSPVHPSQVSQPQADATRALLTGVRTRLTVVIVLGVVAGLAYAAQTAIGLLPDPPTRWQYTIESPPDEALVARLVELGASGWELIFARRATGAEAEGVRKVSYELILRRPLHPGEAAPIPPPPSR